MTIIEHENTEAAGMAIGDAWNVLHWAMIGKATGSDLADRAKEAMASLDKARAILAAAAAAAK